MKTMFELKKTLLRLLRQGDAVDGIDLPIVGDCLAQLDAEMNGLLWKKNEGNRISNLVRQFQSDANYLLNCITVAKNIQIERLDSLSAYENLMIAMLKYIRKAYPNYFDSTLPMPSVCRAYSYQKLSDMIKVVSALTKKHTHNPLLVEAVLQSLAAFGRDNHQSYLQFAALKSALPKLTVFLREEVTIQTGENLLLLLIAIWPNEPVLLAGLKKYILAQLAEYADDNSRLDQCYYYEKLCYNLSNQTDLARLLIDFLQMEQKYYHQKANVFAQSFTPKANMPTHYRMQVNLPADGLAYLLRLLIESGVVTAEPRSRLIEFVAQHVATPGIGQAYLSANSLNTKYKQVTQHTAHRVKKVLREMQQLIEVNF